MNIIIALAFFLNAIAPLSVVAKEFSTSDNVATESLFGDKILICTPTGFKYISIDELNASQNGNQNGPQNHCLLCQISMSGNILYAIDLTNTFEFQYYKSAQKINDAELYLKPTSVFNTSKPRAPPVFL